MSIFKVAMYKLGEFYCSASELVLDVMDLNL